MADERQAASGDADLNRDLWTQTNAEYTQAHAVRAWASEEITWGIFNIPERQVGVPMTPFPRWVRCPRCHRLGPLDPPGQFELIHRHGRRPTWPSSCTRTAHGRPRPAPRTSEPASRPGSWSSARTGTWTTFLTSNTYMQARPSHATARS